MRSYDDAAKWWPQLQRLSSLSELKIAILDRSNDNDNIPIQALRSVTWKIFLLFETHDQAIWSKRLQDSRAAYTSLRSHLLRNIEHPDELESAIDPLSEHEESPWANLRQDEASRGEILQDVERCMPENLYFRQPTTQNMLVDILFVYSKLNPDVGYRQGMHELLAPVVWVVERDAIDQESPQRGQDRNILAMLDSQYIEHDAFTIFGLIMQSAKAFYETSSAVPNDTRPQGETSMVQLCKRVFEDYLPRVDPELASHLGAISILPQVFLLRWVRLLFGREFCFNDMLEMWDVIFAEDPALEIVDLVCIVMILRIRWQLVEADYTTALTLLLRYPEPPNTHGAKSFVGDAIFLKSHFHSDGGSYIVHKYSGRHLPLVSHSGSGSRSPDIPIKPIGDPYNSPKIALQRTSQPVGFETLLQDAARSFYKRGEKWGVNQAVRDAVGEVRKNVQSIQQASRGSPRKSLKPDDTKESNSPEKLLGKISKLEERNRALAKMLEGAVAELWDHHKSASEVNDVGDDSGNALSMAIAKVQFVQVYLDDSTVPLPEVTADASGSTQDDSANDKLPSHSEEVVEPSGGSHGQEQEEKESGNKRQSTLQAAETIEQSAAEDSPPNTLRSTSTSTTRQKFKPINLISQDDSRSEKIPSSAPSTQTSFPQNTSTPSPKPANLNQPRPSLAQSSFSWMLGEDRRQSSFVSASPFPAERRRHGHSGAGKNDFLFGHEDESQSAPKNNKGGKAGKNAPKGKEKDLEPEEVFDLGEIERSGSFSKQDK
ncbi:MAG: hypothetical protein M1820_007558 [Bogoriella megaspora]|nr:MAG: hypothetical protein M1820_007558 [Bogoriella megaspora]